MKKFNGKSMSHWQNLAHELVLRYLMDATATCDRRSIVGDLTYKRLMELINSEKQKIKIKSLTKI